MTLMMMKRISFPHFDQKSGDRERSKEEEAWLADTVSGRWGWIWGMGAKRVSE